MGKKLIKVVRFVDVAELGRAGGTATAANRTPAERKQAAKLAIRARWEAYYKANPDKLKAKMERNKTKTRNPRGRPKKNIG